MGNFSKASAFYLTLLSLISDFFPHTFANKCDEDTFYLPYVHVKKKKNGGAIVSLKSSGFLDLRFRNRVILCINGPVVLYGDVERLDPDAKLTAANDRSKQSLSNSPESRFPSPEHDVNEYDFIPEEELRFRKGELVVFNHQCISINKVPSSVLKKMKEDQARSNPEIMPDTQVSGRLVLGVFLIGNKEGHNLGEMAWFKGKNFDYIKTRDKTVQDSSFIISGSDTSHCMRLPDGTHIKISGAHPGKETGTTHEVCRWTVKEEDKHWYAKLFQRGYDGNGVRNGEPTLEESDYEIYECPDSDPDREIILTMSKTTPEPVSHVNYTEFDPFSLFNPNLWTPHGFRKDSNGLSGGDERTEDKALNVGGSDAIPCSLDPVGCIDGGDVEMTTLKDMQNVDAISANNYEILAEDCIALPEFDPNACNGIGDNGQRLMELVLELEPAFKCGNGSGGEGEAAAPPAEGEGGGGGGKEDWPKCKNLDDDEALSWKMDILCLVSDIFQHLCMPFRPEMPFMVARVFGWYVYKAHMYGENMGRVGPPPGSNSTPPVSSQFDRLIEKTDQWIILEKELERCRTVARQENGGKGLKFQWEVGDETGKWKIPAIDGRATRRRRRRAASPRRNPIPEYPFYQSFKQRRSKRSVKKEEKKREAPMPKVKEEDEGVEHEHVEEIDAMTGEKTLHRQKRSYWNYKREKEIPIPGISKKYILPGKSLTPVESEGTLGYVREVIQEYRPKPDLNDPRADNTKYVDYPENVHHCWNPQEDPVNKQIVCAKTEEIFYYEDKAEIEYELNIAIDIWWKIWATVIGYCNKAYYSRKSETFPRLYNSKYEYFFDLIMQEWKWPEDNEDLKIIFSEYLTEESHMWLDTCLEASYINSQSHSYRPPRPMTIKENTTEISNYFDEIPAYIYYRYHPEPSGTMK